ncbi:NADPH-dependent FMN reductase [Neobacillus sp. LXY-4]|uniref:NADPH-dependent FMN reductase n=1 Tax=Neobacillus sp. LXY-4 TaxID=3379826 RepID=UPI003EE25D98
MSNIVIISGSPSQPSRSSAISTFLENKTLEEGLKVSKISVRDLPAEDLLFANFNSPVIKEKLTLIQQANAVIIVSPVYKASFPGALKAFLDLIPEKGFENKAVLPVVTGGTIAHLLSLEYAFKPVFSVLGSQEILNGVYFQDNQISYKEDQLSFIDHEIKQRLENSLKGLLERFQTKQLIN